MRLSTVLVPSLIFIIMNNYVYTLINSIDGIPFYVGLGTGNRMYSHKACAMKGKNPHGNGHLGNKIRKIISEGGDIVYRKEIENVMRETAKQVEVQKIKEYGRYDTDGGPLCNMTNGGEDGGGFKLTPEQKKRATENSRIAQQNLTPLQRKERGERMKSYLKNEDLTKKAARFEKLRIAATNQHRPDNIGDLIRAGQPKNMKAWNKGLTMEDGHKKKLSEIHKQSQKCKDWIKKLHDENKKTGRLRGNASKCYKNLSQSEMTELLDLYKSGWGYTKIHSYLTKIKKMNIGRTLVVNRIRESGIPLRKTLTNFKKSSTLE